MRALCLAVLATLLAGCASEQEAYCEAVEEHQEPLGEIAASGDAARSLEVLPAYRDLRERAPRDIADDWDVVVRALEELDRALDEAGVDASYDAQDPPDGVTPEERRSIAGAADALGSRATLEAMSSVEQHALDVCGTPLSR